MFDLTVSGWISWSYRAASDCTGRDGIGVSMAGLASAVANEGGVGVLSAAGIGMLRRPHAADPAGAIVQALSDEIALTRSKMRAGLLVSTL
jgi:nitronate monooxygenase